MRQKYSPGENHFRIKYKNFFSAFLIIFIQMLPTVVYRRFTKVLNTLKPKWKNVPE